MPHHHLTIKTGGLYQLMCNISIDRGLVKNVQVIVTGLGQRLLTIRIVHPTPHGTIIDDKEFLLPHINFRENVYSSYTLLRQQYPLRLAYATMFHSCQGLMLNKIGVDLSSPVFTHGQLYIALSRIRN
jgi:hypothetical protein